MTLEVRMFNDARNDRTEFLFCEVRNGKLFIAKPIEPLEFHEHEEFKIIDPTFTVSNLQAIPMLQAFAETLDKQGIKTDKDAKIQGTLEATNKHLEDMRKLVFKLIGDEDGME